ncbi:MAG: VanW family protein [Clostridia bacterium]
METGTNKKKPMGKGARIIVALLAVVLILGATILFIRFNEKLKAGRYEQIINSVTFHKGVTVNNVDISGMTTDEAKAALADVEAQLVADLRFELVCNGVPTTITAANLNVMYTTDSILKEASGFARQGNLDALNAELEDIRANGRNFTIDYTVAPESISAYLDSFAKDINTAPTPATFTVRQLETNSATNAAKAQNLGLPKDNSTTDLRDLRFDFVEAVDGYGVDVPALTNLLSERIQARSFGKIDVPLAPIKSDITIETLKQQLVLRGSAFTSYARGHYGRATRVHNMTKATGLMYGTVLQPNDIFSCNTILGDRTEKNGWQMAPAVIEGGAATEDQPGGGVCQVSTTLYNAVLKGDLLVTDRRAHSQKLSYVDGGFDATINTGTIDFQWQNNTQSPVYVFTWIDTENKRINCEIYGAPFPEQFDTIELLSEEKPAVEPTEPTYTVDPSLVYPNWMLKNDAQRGYVFDTYMLYKKDGKLVEKKMIGETTYRMHPARYLVWDGWAGEPLWEEYKLVYTRD